MMLQTGTSACKMRDELRQARYDKKITTIQIEDKLRAMNIPKWLQSEILQMEAYRKYERCTDPIEQAMAKAVYGKIVDELIEKENKK